MLLSGVLGAVVCSHGHLLLQDIAAGTLPSLGEGVWSGSGESLTRKVGIVALFLSYSLVVEGQSGRNARENHQSLGAGSSEWKGLWETARQTTSQAF